MDDIRHRLQQARRLAGFATASDAARRFGWNENTYRSHENGERGIKSRIAEQYASALKVDIRWLLLGEAEDRFAGRLLVPTRGSILSGGRLTDDVQLFKGGDKIFYSAAINFSVQEDTFAYLISDDGLLPRYGKHDLLLFWGEPRKDMLKYSQFYQEGIGWDSDGNGYFGHLSHNGRTSNIQCVNSAPFHELSIERFDVVQAIVRRHSHSGEAIIREEDQ